MERALATNDLRRLSPDIGVVTIAWQTRTVGEATIRGPLDEVVRRVVADLRRYDALEMAVAS